MSVLVRGLPGVGKSTMARELACDLALPLIDIRLAQRDPAEIGGIYVPDRDHGVLSLLPPEWVKRACVEPCFVFLDELNAAVSKLHQAVAYQIVLDTSCSMNDQLLSSSLQAVSQLARVADK